MTNGADIKETTTTTTTILYTVAHASLCIEYELISYQNCEITFCDENVFEIFFNSATNDDTYYNAI